MFDYVGIAILVLIFLSALWFYIANVFKLVTALENEKYTVRTALRCGGIFFFALGIVMGLVNDE